MDNATDPSDKFLSSGYGVIMPLKLWKTEPSFKICTGKFSDIKGVHISLLLLITGAQPKAGTGLKMQTVRFFNVTLLGIYR